MPIKVLVYGLGKISLTILVLVLIAAWIFH